MNSTARLLTAHDAFTSQEIRQSVFSWRNLLLSAAIGFIVLNACAVIYVTDWNRRLFGELQALHQIHEELSVEKGQLLLEQTTWAAQARIQKIAHDRLDMGLPTSQSIVMLRP